MIEIIKLQAMLVEQRNVLNAIADRCLHLAAEVAALQAQINGMQTTEPPKKKRVRTRSKPDSVR